MLVTPPAESCPLIPMWREVFRIAEAVLQLRGEAEKRQVPGVKTALAHSTHGFAGQNHSVVILGNILRSIENETRRYHWGGADILWT